MSIDHRKVETSAEVWAVIHARHGKEIQVYSSFSDPDGEFHGPGHAEMMTEYCLPGADCPLIGARTTWEIPYEEPRYVRKNEKTEYWLCVPINGDNE